MAAIGAGEAGPMAAGLGTREALSRRLDAPELAAVGRAAAHVGARRAEDVGRDDFADPAIAALMTQVAERVDRGPGAVLLTGLDIAALGGEEGFARVVAGLGARLGTLAPQSAQRDRIGRVERLSGGGQARGYTSDAELAPHTDFHEIAALACVRPAAEGGLTRLVSIAAVHDILAREAPEMLAPLARGYRQDTTGDGRVSDEPMPVMSRHDGVVSGYAQGLFLFAAARALGEALPVDLVAAMRAFAAASWRRDVLLEFRLEPGEILFWHNFRVLHGRTAFRDDPAQRRLLLRLWINPFVQVPLPPAYHAERRRLDALHAAGRTAVHYLHTGLKV